MTDEGGTPAPAPATEFLDRATVDGVIAAITADDLIEATAAKGTDGGGVLLLKVAFCRAAERLGLGPDATLRVRGSDFRYLAEQMGEVINVDHPLSEATARSLRSADSGA